MLSSDSVIVVKAMNSVVAHPGRPRLRLPKGVERVGYSTRNMRLDYLDRLRILAAYARTTLDAQVLAAIGRGLSLLESEQRRKKACP